MKNKAELRDTSNKIIISIIIKGRDYDTEYDFDRILAVEITQIQNGFSCGDKNLILHRFFAEDLEP
jgi:hypothetical protein